MNKVYLIGNLSRDPEVSETPNGTKYCRFGLAVNRQVGEERIADFYNITAWRRAAETIAKYCKKGNKIAIDGEISLNSYKAKDGVEKISVDVTVSGFEFLTPKGDSVSHDEKKPELAPDNSGDDSPF